MQDRSQFAADVVVGIDVAKGKHFVCALTTDGERLFSRPVPNDEGAIRPPPLKPARFSLAPRLNPDSPVLSRTPETP